MSELEIHKTLVLSTAHMTREDSELLAEAQHDVELAGMTPVTYEMDEYGWMVYVSSESLISSSLSQFSEGFRDAVEMAQAHGCLWVRFDRDANVVGELKTYDW